jgi:SAM-dependent methyltransferase
MTPEQREAVRENALYLRNVRPVDPEEVCEYVEGRPHPATVRQVLREEAWDLGLVEREDGAFEPVPDEPVGPRSGPVESFPDRYARVLEDRLADRYGPTWWAGDSGDRLRDTVRRLKDDYYRGRSVEYDADAAYGYAVYHLPDYYAAVQYVLDGLAGDGLLPRRLRVLDVGAGVGGPALGLADYLPDDALLAYHAVEPSPAADLLEALLGEAGRNVHATLHRETAEEFDPAGPLEPGQPDGDGRHGYDLLLFANVLSELDDPVAVVERYAEHLASDGSLVLLAPADLETSTGLREIERELETSRDLTVYSPTVRLWPGFDPSDRGWSFDERPPLEVAPFQRRLGEDAQDPGAYHRTAVRYSWTALRTDGRRRQLGSVPTCVSSSARWRWMSVSGLVT